MPSFDALYLRGSIRMTPGRVRWVAWEIGNRLTADEREFLGPFVERAVAEGARAHSLIATRKQVKKKLYGKLAKEKDGAVDEAARGVFGLLESFGQVFSAETELGARVRRLSEAFFPKSLSSLTNAGYADELEEVNRIVALAKGELRAYAAAVPGLERLLAVLEERAAEFAKVIRTEPAPASAADEALAAALEADRRMFELAMAICVHHHGDGDEATRRRAELLAPYENQQESMRQRFRRRQPIVEVDPETGEELEGEPEADELDTAPGRRREPEPAA